MPATAEADTPRVRVAEASKASLRPTFESFGTLVYQSKADVYAGVEGRIEEVLVEEGQRVGKGQPLVVFARQRLLTSKEQTEAEVASKEARVSLTEEKLREGRKAVEARMLEIDKAEAELVKAQSEYQNIAQVYENKRKLFEAGGIAEGELQGLHTRFIAAQMELTRARKNLEITQIGFRDEDLLAAGYEIPDTDSERLELLTAINTGMLAAEHRVAEAECNAAGADLQRITMMLAETTARAPIDGIVGRRFVESGEKADRETLLMTIFNTDSVYAQLEVAEGDLRRLQVGQPAELCFQGEPESAVEGTVELIAPYIDPKARTARVRIAVDNAEGTLIPGMFTRIRIFTGPARDVVRIPEGALSINAEQLTEGSSIVWVVRESRLFPVEVQWERGADDDVAVLSGLRAGETVVVDAPADLDEGMQVEVVP